MRKQTTYTSPYQERISDPNRTFDAIKVEPGWGVVWDPVGHPAFSDWGPSAMVGPLMENPDEHNFVNHLDPETFYVAEIDDVEIIIARFGFGLTASFAVDLDGLNNHLYVILKMTEDPSHNTQTPNPIDESLLLES